MRSTAKREPGVALLLALLEHPLRIQILSRLVQRPKSPTEIAAELGVSIGVADYHLRHLVAAKLARFTRRHRPPGRRGHPLKYYEADPPVISEGDWITIPPLVRAALTQAAVRELASRAEASHVSQSRASPETTLGLVANDLTALLGVVTTSLVRVDVATDSDAPAPEVA
jgi:DNA-binding transcriptional ArsR family regulator